jgi:hypothetical protein
LLQPSATNREIASTFVVSENYFSVLGVKTERGRAFDAMSPSELAASPAGPIRVAASGDRARGHS